MEPGLALLAGGLERHETAASPWLTSCSRYHSLSKMTCTSAGLYTNVPLSALTEEVLVQDPGIRYKCTTEDLQDPGILEVAGNFLLWDSTSKRICYHLS